MSEDNNFHYDPGYTSSRWQRAKSLADTWADPEEKAYRVDIFPFDGSTTDLLGKTWKTVFVAYYIRNTGSDHYMHRYRIFYCPNDYFAESLMLTSNAIDMDQYYDKEEVFVIVDRYLHEIANEFREAFAVEHLKSSSTSAD